MLHQPAALLLTLAAVLLRLTVVYSFTATVLPLDRVFPANQWVELEVLRARDRTRHARILQSYGGGVVNFAVEGTSDPSIVGLYFTRVKLGTPPREYNVQIDTGSDLLWVTCNSCSDCPRTSGLGVELNFYDTTSSSTASLVSCLDPLCSSKAQITSSQCSAETNQCGYSFQYGDGSGTSGFYVSDILYFDMILGNSMANNSSASIVFGCSTYQSGDLATSGHAIDGIFGFGQQGLSVVSQLSSKRIAPMVFSHCLKGGGNGGGILVFGEILDPNIVYSPLIPSQPHYNLDLESIAINGQLLPIDQAVFTTSNNRGIIIDSGTTLAYLIEEVYNPLVSRDGAGLWCMGFQKAQDQGVMILGDLVLKDKIFVYDLARQRIGWANYDCSLSVNVSVNLGRDEFINAGQFSVSSASKSTLFEGFVAHILISIAFLIVCQTSLSSRVDFFPVFARLIVTINGTAISPLLRNSLMLLGV